MDPSSREDVFQQKIIYFSRKIDSFLFNTDFLDVIPAPEDNSAFFWF
jgi:hypothetical protein